MEALQTAFERGNGQGPVFRSRKTGEPLGDAKRRFEDAVSDAKNRLHEVVSPLKATDTRTDTSRTAILPDALQISVN